MFFSFRLLLLYCRYLGVRLPISLPMVLRCFRELLLLALEVLEQGVRTGLELDVNEFCWFGIDVEMALSVVVAVKLADDGANPPLPSAVVV